MRRQAHGSTSLHKKRRGQQARTESESTEQRTQEDEENDEEVAEPIWHGSESAPVVSVVAGTLRTLRLPRDLTDVKKGIRQRAEGRNEVLAPLVPLI
jgi:hypothetical protein